MVRIAFVLALVVVGVAFAQGCTTHDDCDCGSVCQNSVCESGCLVYGQLLPAGDTAKVFGITCTCKMETDDNGRPIMCDSDGVFVDPPADQEKYVTSSKCTQPVAEVVPVAEVTPAA